MVKAFDEREKEAIRKALLDKGREFFSTFGLKKTSIKDLTDAVGIAQGSFYIFFPSKEVLYFEILEIEEELMKGELLKELTSQGQLTREGFKNFLQRAFQLVAENAFLQRVFIGDEYEQLIRKLPAEKIAEHQVNDTDLLLPLILHWQSEGQMIKCRPEAIAGLTRALFTVILHKKEIGEAVFAETVELLIDCIASGLVRE